MNSSIYRWSLRPGAGLSLELRVVATNASIARREVMRFLSDHDGIAWTVESVSRENPRTLREHDQLASNPRVHAGWHS